MYDMHIYAISAEGTAFEGLEVLCLKVKDGIYYCPDRQLMFFKDKPNKYSWEYAIMKSYDSIWRDLKKNPFWRTNVCRPDAPTLILTDEELDAAL